jgi:hypothetical protein
MYDDLIKEKKKKKKKKPRLKINLNKIKGTGDVKHPECKDCTVKDIWCGSCV